MNTRRLRPLGSRQVTISFGNVLMKRGSVRSSTVTRRFGGPSPPNAPFRPRVSVRKPGKSDAGVFIVSVQRVSEDPFRNLLRVEKLLGQPPRRLAVALIIRVDRL